MHRLNWSDLQFLITVANHGSLAAAARELGVNHSTVQRRVTTFERDYGVSVFHRQPDGYKLTRQGQILMENARGVEQAVFDLERKITAKDTALSGTIRLTTTDTLFGTLVGDVLSNFRVEYPDVRFEMSITSSQLSLHRRAADVAIRPCPELPEGLTGWRICDIGFKIFSSAEYAARHAGKPIEELDWLFLDDAMLASTPGRWLQKNVPDSAIVFRADSLLALAHAAEAGLGVALLPDYLVPRHAKLTELYQSTDPPLDNGLWVLTHPDLAQSGRIRTFMEYASDKIADRQALSRSAGH